MKINWRLSIRFICSVVITLIPINILKIVLYKSLFNYDISWNCKIGFSLIMCKSLTLKQRASIGNFNWIYGVGTIELEANASIGDRNRINHLKSIKLGSESIIRKGNRLFRNSEVGRGGNFILGRQSIVTLRHIFDLTDNISIGDNTVIGGEGSQFWTHGFDIYRNGIEAPIVIKDNCYMGSACLVNLGITVESQNQIGMGTVISKSINTHFGFWTSNHLIRNNECKDISQSDKYSLDNVENKFYVFAEKR